MSSVTRIDSHPNFRKNTGPVEHDPIVGLDGDLSENEFMKHSFEPHAVRKFLCDMGFILSDNLAAILVNGESIIIDVPPTFASLSYACGALCFRTRDSKSRKILIGRLGIACGFAMGMWKEEFGKKIA
jgi:hypothetical protein